jgi:hypothetical protein
MQKYYFIRLEYPLKEPNGLGFLVLINLGKIKMVADRSIRVAIVVLTIVKARSIEKFLTGIKVEKITTINPNIRAKEVKTIALLVYLRLL